MVYAKENLLEHIATLQPEGFSMLEDSFGYLRADGSKKEVIHLATRNYFPHGACIHGMSAHISFLDIEDALRPLYRAQGIGHSDNYTLKRSLVDVDGVDYEQLDQEISDDESFGKVRIELQKLLDAALSFFDQLQTVADAADLLAEKSAKEIVPYIQGTILMPKTILLLQRAGHERFEEKRAEFHALLKGQAAKRKQAQADLTVFEQLFDHETGAS
ncbi:MAG: hypothetical protein AAGA85_18075 [Bacteroidota bacterium]